MLVPLIPLTDPLNEPPISLKLLLCLPLPTYLLDTSILCILNPQLEDTTPRFVLFYLSRLRSHEGSVDHDPPTPQ